MVKIGIIGTGHMGSYHVSSCLSIKDVDLVGISDLDEKKLKKIKSSKVKKTKDFREWLPKVDGVIIAVPTNYHYEVSKECLEKGKHVLVEKPLTKNFSQAKELFEIAAKNNVALHVGHVERFNGAVQELKNIIDKPYFIEAHRLGPFVPRVQSDSVVLDLMIHDLDIVLDLVDSKVESVNFIGNKIKSNLSDVAVVQLKFENGVCANLVSSRISHVKKRSMSVHQKNSFIKLDFTTQSISLHHNPSDSVKVGRNQLEYRQGGTVERLFVYKDNPLTLEIKNFVKSIKTGKNKIDSKKDLEALRLALEIESKIGIEYGCNNSWNRKYSSACM